MDYYFFSIRCMNCENLGCTHSINNENQCIILYLGYFACIALTSNLKNKHYYLENTTAT